MNGIDLVGTWHFIREGSLTDDVRRLLVGDERVIKVYKTVRDIAVVTDMRLIVRDVQGLTGQKVEVYSIPWDSVQMWSSENAGKVIDVDAELELWTLVGRFKINLARNVDIRELDRVIAERVFR